MEKVLEKFLYSLIFFGGLLAWSIFIIVYGVALLIGIEGDMWNSFKKEFPFPNKKYFKNIQTEIKRETIEELNKVYGIDAEDKLTKILNEEFRQAQVNFVKDIDNKLLQEDKAKEIKNKFKYDDRN